MRWENFIQAFSCKRLGKHPGGVPEWPKGADCKSAGSAFDGSNPSPSTIFSYATISSHENKTCLMRWENFIQAFSCKRLGKHPGGVPEWPKGADCKSAGSAFDGSNPSPSTIYRKASSLSWLFSFQNTLKISEN